MEQSSFQVEACPSFPAMDKSDQLLSVLQVQLHVQHSRPSGPSTLQASDCVASDEPDGGSPTSERSASVQLCGPHPHRTQPPPPKRMFRWLVRQLQRKQQQQHASSDEQQPFLVCGSSYGSLSELDVQAPASEQLLPSLGLEQQQHTHATQQLTASALQQQCGPRLCQLPAVEEPVNSSSSSSSDARGADGLLRRGLKAVLRPLVRAACGAARAFASSAGPQGPGNNDNSMAERIINVLTSLPFIAVGLHGLRNRRCPKGRHFALSFLALGAVASGYHGADRSSWLRPVMRKLDYYTICYTSTVLRRAAHIPLPSAVSVASLLIAPVKPSMVTGLNLLLVEGKFLRSALAHSHLRTTFKAHLGSAAAGMVCFAYEDVATGWGWPPVLHSLWHCLSALAMGSLHGLLQHLELAVLMEGVQLEAAGSS